MPDASKSGDAMSYHCRVCNQFWISETSQEAREKLCGPCERQLKEYTVKAKHTQKRCQRCGLIFHKNTTHTTEECDLVLKQTKEDE